MLIDAYTVVPTSEVEFKFECDCDSGIIKKVVRYDLLSTKLGDKDLYNLAFGPYNEDGKILDSKKTNTNDLLKTFTVVRHLVKISQFCAFTQFKSHKI